MNSTSKVAPRRPAATKPPATRGPRSAGDIRRDILEAARDLFAERGFRGTTTRQIAERARVDTALIHYFFRTKAGLFEAALDLPRIAAMVRGHLAAAPGDRADALARLYFEELYAHERRTFAALLRTAIEGGDDVQWVRRLLQETVVRAATQALGDDDLLPGMVAGSLMLGVMVTRYLVGIEPIASAPVAEVEARVVCALRALFEEARP